MEADFMQAWRHPLQVQAAAVVVLLGLAPAAAEGQVARSNGGRVYCFAPGTPQEIVEIYRRLPLSTGELTAEPQFYTETRWSGTTGSPRALTWSFIPDGVTIKDHNSVNQSSALFSQMDARFAGAGGRATWIALFESSFNRWAQLSGVSYSRIRYAGQDWDDGASFGTSGSSARGDVRIGMVPMDGQYGILAFNYYPSHGDMVLDSAENWASSSNNYRFFRNIIMHEHGHGLGLDHVCPSNGTKLMEPYLNTNFDGPQHDDIRGVHSFYGDDTEDDNTTATARDVGTVNAGSPLMLGTVPAPAVSNGSILSIDANGEQDYFRFTAGVGQAVSVTVTPIGLSYDSSTQNENGTCNSGTTINSLTMADLNVRILATNGTTVIATGASQPAGQPETLSNVLLPGAGDYYIRVYEGNTPAGPQLYQVALSAAVLDCNQNGVPDNTDILNGTSQDCNSDGTPDECQAALDSNGDGRLDSCQKARGDFDLDGDVDQTDFGHLQECLTGPSVVPAPACQDADLDGILGIDGGDMAKFIGCMSGAGMPLNWSCR
jgi:hypothetical protein